MRAEPAPAALRPAKVAAVLMLVGGMLLRLYQVDYNLDLDEVFSVEAARGTLAQTVSVALHDVHPPLYYLLLHAWIKMFGTSELSVRTLSILAALLFLLTTWRLASRLLPAWLAGFVLFVCATSPLFVYYGQQARPYAFIAVFSTLSLFLLLRAHDCPSSHTRSLLYGLCCAALMYTQYLAVLLLVPQFISLLLSSPRRHARTLVYGFAGTALVGPWALATGPHLLAGNSEGIGWITRPTLLDLWDFYIGIFGWLPIRHAGTVLIVLTGIALSSLILTSGRAGWSRLILVASVAALPPVVLFVVSSYATASLWGTRQLIGSAGFAVLLLGLGLSLHRRWVALPIAVALALWSVINVPDAFPEHSKPPWRALASGLNENCAECGIVVFELWAYRPLAYYSDKQVSYWRDYKKTASKGRRVALVFRPLSRSELSELEAGYRTVSERSIRWTRSRPDADNTITVRLLEPRAP